MKKFLTERAGGLFLLIFAFLLISVFSLGRRVESNEIAKLSFDGQGAKEEEILGDEVYVSSEVEIFSNQAEIVSLPFEETDAEIKTDEIARQEALKASNIAKEKAEAKRYAELKNDLEKYCDKKYNSKKCKKYLSEAKALSKTSKEYKKLYEKYLEKKEDREDDSDDSKSTVISSDEKALTLDFVVKSVSGEQKFEIQFVEGETVYAVMRRAKEQGKLSYEKNTDETYGVYINTINGLKEGAEADWTQNKYWILYVSGKSSSLGCSNHKLEKSDSSIEWRYEKYSF